MINQRKVTTPSLSHIDTRGQARMVDVAAKAVTRRRAVAQAVVTMLPSTATLLKNGTTPKGDVLAAVRIAAVMGAKQTSTLIPLCHPLPLTHVSIEIQIKRGSTLIEVVCETLAQTGVEMEALTAASIGALTLYDMLKAVDRGMTFTVGLSEKSGGASGSYKRVGKGPASTANKRAL